jgi:hypothetical protein
LDPQLKDAPLSSPPSNRRSDKAFSAGRFLIAGALAAQSTRYGATEFVTTVPLAGPDQAAAGSGHIEREGTDANRPFFGLREQSSTARAAAAPPVTVGQSLI